jgi:hypothetical protein
MDDKHILLGNILWVSCDGPLWQQESGFKRERTYTTDALVTQSPRQLMEARCRYLVHLQNFVSKKLHSCECDERPTDCVHPTSNRHDPIKEDRHPPCPSPDLLFQRVSRRWKVLPRSVGGVDGKSAGIIQTQWDSYTCLETGVDPDLNPSPFLIKVPRQHDARLHDLKDILPAGHRPVDVLSRFAGMEFCKLVSTCSVWSHRSGV